MPDTFFHFLFFLREISSKFSAVYLCGFNTRCSFIAMDAERR